MFDVITNVTGDPVTGAFTPGSGANNFLYFGRIRTSGEGTCRRQRLRQRFGGVAFFCGG